MWHTHTFWLFVFIKWPLLKWGDNGCNGHRFIIMGAFNLMDHLWSQKNTHVPTTVTYSVMRCNVPVLFNRTIFLVLLFSQYARNVNFPLPIYRAKKGWTSYKLQVFKMFPVSKHLVQVSTSYLFDVQPFLKNVILGTSIVNHVCIEV